jgi:steroid delta-isomerase-like uncharacterized protein
MLYTQDGVFEDVPFNALARSHDEMKDFWQGTWTAMPDFTMTLVSAVADEHRGAAEWIMSATQTGSFQGLPATGKPFTLRAASMARFTDGRIAHWADYWSLSSFKQQVGLE